MDDFRSSCLFCEISEKNNVSKQSIAINNYARRGRTAPDGISFDLQLFDISVPTGSKTNDCLCNTARSMCI